LIGFGVPETIAMTITGHNDRSVSPATTADATTCRPTRSRNGLRTRPPTPWCLRGGSPVSG